LGGDVEDGLQIEFAAALLEEIFEGLAQQVHDHNVEHFAVVGFFVADKVQEGHEGLAAHLVDELALPEEHDVPLHLHSFFLQIQSKPRFEKERP